MKQIIKKLKKVDFVILQLKLIIEDHLTDSEWYLLAYFILYGDKFKEKMLEDEISLSLQTVNNITSKFIKEGILVSERIPMTKKRTYTLDEGLSKSIELTDCVYMLKLEIVN
jgi:hypothetical protein